LGHARKQATTGSLHGVCFDWYAMLAFANESTAELLQEFRNARTPAADAAGRSTWAQVRA
jgi:hypothetical protein